MTLSDRISALGDQGCAVTTVRHLVDAIGAPLLSVLASPSGLDGRVRTTVLHDPIDQLPDEPDALLLLSGTRADSAAAIEVVREAGPLGYCAVVVKRRGGDLEPLLAEAAAQGIAVLAAADEVSWPRLDSLLQSVLGSQGVGDASTAGSGDELFALANAIAAVIGGSVAIEDIDRRLLAYSSLQDQRIDEIRMRGILDRRVPDMERNLTQYRMVLDAEGVVQFPEVIDELARSAIAIRAGSQPLGTIWAIVGEGGTGSDGEREMLDGARIAALHMLRRSNAGELELQVRESALRGALDGSLSAQDFEFRLALPGGAQMTLVGVAPFLVLDGTTPLITHVGSALSRYVSAFRPDAAVATTSRAVYVLLPQGGEAAAQRLARGALKAISKSFESGIRAAISFTSTDPADIPAMRREIDDILRVTTGQADLAEVASLSDVHARVLLAHVADELARRPRLRHPGVDAMVTFDIENRTEYVASVTAWMDCVGDMAAAATTLGVHPNTLRYRLRRVDELFEVSMDRPDDRLSLWLQLRLAPH